MLCLLSLDNNAKGEMVSEEDATEETLNKEAAGSIKIKACCITKGGSHHKHCCITTLYVIIAILIICIISIIIVACAVSPLKSNRTCSNPNVSVPLVPACATGWIGYEGKCYFFSEAERNWTSGQNFCTSYGSSLATIESEPEKVFMLRYKGKADHWIGLWKDTGQPWKWADGTEFRNTVVVGGGGGGCAFLSTDIAIASRCYITRNWICNHPDAYRRNKSSTIRQC